MQASGPAVAGVGTQLSFAGANYRVTVSGDAPEVELEGAPGKSTVNVPATVDIDGVSYKVTSIAVNAFKGNKVLVKVVVGDNIVSIGKSAFQNCPKLKSVVLGKSVAVIGKNVFAGDKKLKIVKVKSGALSKSSIVNIVKKSKVSSIKLSGKAAKAKRAQYKKFLGKKARVK